MTPQMILSLSHMSSVVPIVHVEKEPPTKIRPTGSLKRPLALCRRLLATNAIGRQLRDQLDAELPPDGG